jgi:hypothetical protein
MMRLLVSLGRLSAISGSLVSYRNDLKARPVELMRTPNFESTLRVSIVVDSFGATAHNPSCVGPRLYPS